MAERIIAESKAEPSARRECPLCHRVYAKLTDHLHKKHNLTDWVERQPHMQEALKKVPDLHVQSE